MLSIMVRVQSVEHHLRPNDRQHQNEREVLITQRGEGYCKYCKFFCSLYCPVCLQVVVNGQVHESQLEAG